MITTLNEIMKPNLLIKECGNPDIKFTSESGLLLAKGYRRVVFGGRGAYVEFDYVNIHKDSFYIPKLEQWRVSSQFSFYIEMRSTCESYVKLYLQQKTVSYADYLIEKFYIAPADLYINGKCVVVQQESNSIEEVL